MLRLDPAAWARLPALWACACTMARRSDEPHVGLPEPRSVLRSGIDLERLKEDPVAAGYRRISWSVGVDPTKRRPAGEALARRILTDGALPRIHPLVDAYNLASAHTLVPLSAYDLGRIRTPVTIQPLARPETCLGIGRSAEEPLDEGRIVYRAADGTLCGVMLWRDAQASRVREDSERVLLLAVGAAPLEPNVGLEALHAASEYATRVGWRQDGPIVQVAAE